MHFDGTVLITEPEEMGEDSLYRKSGDHKPMPIA